MIIKPVRLCSKAAHENYEYALRQIRSTARYAETAYRLKPYRCLTCGAWHVGPARLADKPTGQLLTFLIEAAEKEDKARNEAT